jgi:hypothetical protein
MRRRGFGSNQRLLCGAPAITPGWRTVRKAPAMRTHVVTAVVVLISCVLLAPACLQSPTERIREAAQAAYEDTFHFVVDVKDDGEGAAGGWQIATGPYYVIRHTGSPGEDPHEVAREIEATYAGYQPIPPEIGDVVVPDVALDTRGFGEVTIANCLLSTHWAAEDAEPGADGV